MASPPEFRYTTHPSTFGRFAIIWIERPGGPEVRGIVLPVDGEPADAMGRFPDARRGGHRTIADLSRDIEAFLGGGDVAFPLSMVHLAGLGEFQQRVLKAEHAIPRGGVSTYGAIATHIGSPGAARAVGRALATNPFPIVVPCHRAIRGDGTLGGYQGGLAMKRALLEFEGVSVSSNGRVVDPRHFYTSGA